MSLTVSVCGLVCVCACVWCAPQACAANSMKDEIPGQLEEMHALLSAK